MLSEQLSRPDIMKQRTEFLSDGFFVPRRPVAKRDQIEP